MSPLAIRVENLGKRYRLGQLGRRNSHKTLRDALASATAWPFRKARTAMTRNGGYPRETPGILWALKDVSFEVRQGEVLGIIGRNGAGKSTLLKILSRITPPTRGRVEGYGRVGSLLEVGTGFHPELTGRENVYLNGAVLGMKRAEINLKFDEIVAFAEVEKFLDTPVKRYSSGMYVRLAFAVAAHLEPEILLVDEVLAVGDAAFQKKCLGNMSDVAKSGRTVLFVSHNLAAVQGLCNEALWIDDGKILKRGASSRIVSEYLQTSFSKSTEKIWRDIRLAPGNDHIRLQRASVGPEYGTAGDPISVRTPIVVEITYWNLIPDAYLNLNFQLYNEQGILIFDAGPNEAPIWRPLPKGLFRDKCYIPGDLLNNGMHWITLKAVSDQGRMVYQQEDLLVFDVQDTDDLRDGWYGKWAGVVRPYLKWDREIINTGIAGTDERPIQL